MNIHSQKAGMAPLAQIAAQTSVDDRGTELLLSIRAAFAEKGFDGASMQDLARAAGVSVGNFYRYFPSKAAIVEALVSHDIAEAEVVLDLISQAPDVRAALRIGLRTRILEDRDEDNCLWAEITAAALRKSDVASTCQRMEARLEARLTAIFAQISGLSHEDCQQRFGAHARYVILMVRTSAARPQNSPDPALDALVLQGLERIIDDIPSRSAAG